MTNPPNLSELLERTDVRFAMQSALSCSLPVDVILTGTQERYIIGNICFALLKALEARALAPTTERNAR